MSGCQWCAWTGCSGLGLDLLVKTYPDGTVSRFFGTLLTVNEAKEAALQNYAPLEEQSFRGELETLLFLGHFLLVESWVNWIILVISWWLIISVVNWLSHFSLGPS